MTDLSVAVPGGMLRPPRDRGALDIADRVVAKIAGRAAAEISGVEVPTAGGIRDRGAPKVEAHLDDNAATVSVVIAVDYPMPVFGTADEVRRRVAGRLAEFAGIHRVDVRVEVDELFVARKSNTPRVV